MPETKPEEKARIRAALRFQPLLTIAGHRFACHGIVYGTLCRSDYWRSGRDIPFEPQPGTVRCESCQSIEALIAEKKPAA